jgi:transposase
MTSPFWPHSLAKQWKTLASKLTLKVRPRPSPRCSGQGGKDRWTMLPQSITASLQAHLEVVRALHQRELTRDRGQVRLPETLERKAATLRQLAYLFSVRLSFLVRLQQRRRQTGTIQPKPPGGGHPPRLDEQACQRHLQLVREQPDATLAELRNRLGIPCSIMTIARALRRHGIRHKKKTRPRTRRSQSSVSSDELSRSLTGGAYVRR